MELSLLLLATVFPVILVSGFTVLFITDIRSNRSTAKLTAARQAKR